MRNSCSIPSENFKYSLPKDYYSYKPEIPLLSTESIIMKEGSDWKATRKHFNSGFQPQHIYSLTEQIVTRVKTFVDRIQRLSNTGKHFRLADYAQDLTFDIVTQTTIGRDLVSQFAPENHE